MLIARSYQTECVSCIWDYFETNAEGNPICILPTGTGKSVCIALFLQKVYQQFPGQKILVLTHVKELIQQNFLKLLELWPGAPAGIYSAGLGRKDLLQKIIFAGIASIIKAAHLLGNVDLVIVDECHLISPNDKTMYKKFFAILKMVNPSLRVIGFTATGYRLGQGRLIEGEDALFTDECFNISTVEAFNRLIAEGYLSPLVPKPTKTLLDVDGLHLRGGEFIEAEQQKAFDKEHITRAAIIEALEYKDTRLSWLVFSTGVEHSEHIAEMLNEYGVKAVAVHSKMPDKQRDDAIRDFKAGKYQAIVNNNILTTGFDHPPIDLILCLRATQSAVLWVQMLGRGTRPYDPANPGKGICPRTFWKLKENCMVLDYARNTRRLGPINDPVIPRAKGKSGGEAPIKECPVCECYMHISVRFCTGVLENGNNCSHEFKFDVKFKGVASEDELIKGDMPVVEVFKVDHINYSRHQKLGRPDSMKATYYCGYRYFTEYVCIEHAPSSGGAKAREWIRKRSPVDMVNLPTTVTELLAMAGDLQAPTHIRVWVNTKHPAILIHCFDGSEFGKLSAGQVKAPSVESEGGSPYLRNLKTGKEQEVDFTDDDIPF